MKYPYIEFNQGEAAYKPNWKYTTPNRLVEDIVIGFRCHLNEKEWVDIEGPVNGASRPLLTAPFVAAYDKDTWFETNVHDRMVGEFDRVLAVVFHKDGTKRKLTWKDSAKTFKALLLVKNSRFKSEVFYQSVMLKKRPKRWLNILRRK